jgi:two-component system, OmpR family, phosphate regulon response regulator PhoB
MANVLVVDDEHDLRAVLAYALQEAGHSVDSVASGAAALTRAFEHPPDIVLLDLMLPDLSGTDVCRMLKHDPRTRAARIIMVSARGEEADRIRGFEVGADDYVVKPFSTRELLLRIAALSRRKDPNPTLEALSLNGLHVNREAHRVTLHGSEVTLTALEFKLLVTLLERRERVLTRDSLLADVWGMESEVETRTVDTHVKRLREKLGPLGDHIQTVRGVGYRLSESRRDMAE